MENEEMKNKDIKNKDILFKEIDLIERIIERMANNSFLIKGWTVTLVTITFLFKNSMQSYFLAIIPLIAFWILDAFFLIKEREYRLLYKWVIENRENTLAHKFDMDVSRFSKEVSKIKTFFSRTLLIFYLCLLILIILFQIF